MSIQQVKMSYAVCTGYANAFEADGGIYRHYIGAVSQRIAATPAALVDIKPRVCQIERYNRWLKK